MDVFCNVTPHCCHKMTKFVSKIYRHAHIFGSVHVHEHGIHSHLIWFDVTLTLIFTPHDNTTCEILKFYFIKMQITWIFNPQKRNNGTACFSFFQLYPPILYNLQAPFNNRPRTLLPHSYSNYHPTLNEFTTLFIIVLKF